MCLSCLDVFGNGQGFNAQRGFLEVDDHSEVGGLVLSSSRGRRRTKVLVKRINSIPFRPIRIAILNLQKYRRYTNTDSQKEHFYLKIHGC